ncbi:MAG: sugar nucleotide-binding protein [Oscillospiraceae bacterium]|nr:sugar nucleotide-binding protein [Oscillospiraceae bacterium]
MCSWYDFAKEFVSLAGIDAEVLPCTSDEYPTPTKRPAYSALDNLALRATVGDEFRPWQDAIREYINLLKEEKFI